eukprot:418047-Alexandrium_andersonii.AAC.1
MSASLVGSEMCIRDRHRTVCFRAAAKLHSAALDNGCWAFRPLPVTEPVSYTHLTLPTICSV